MAKFNSLGSNYDWRAAWRVLTIRATTQKVVSREKSAPIYFYKGREALLAALKVLNLPPGSGVAVVGFTCLTVYEAIIWAGLKPILIDIDKTLNFSFESLKKQTKNLKAIIIQNTFGFSQPKIASILVWAKKNNIRIVEDNAHAWGAIYETGAKAGELGSVAIFSASQDKVLDSVSGGILRINEQALLKNFREISWKEIPKQQQRKDRIYPLLTWLIRHTYSFGLGKLMHFLCRYLGLLSQPMHYQNEGNYHRLPAWQKELLQERIVVAQEQQKERQKKVRLYLKNLRSDFLFWSLTEAEIVRSSALRLPIKVKAEKREEILNKLCQQGYHLQDFWYDSPVGPKKQWEEGSYQENFASLPRGFLVTEEIINLPTHQEITTTDIKNICRIINLCQI